MKQALAVLLLLVLYVAVSYFFFDLGLDTKATEYRPPVKAWSLYLEAKDYEFKRHQEAMGKVGQ
jgi:hypothetical protein